MFKMISWLAVLLGMFLIFSLSSQTAEQSDRLSTIIAEFIVKTVEKFAPQVEFDLKSFNNTLRKYAHFLAYGALGLLVSNALQRSGLSGYRCLFWALGICILFSISDEMHQLFIPGRGGQVQDVIIDSAGALLGIGFYRAFLFKR